MFGTGFNRWNEFDSTFRMLEGFRSQMDRMLGELDRGRSWRPAMGTSWPRINIEDRGEELLLEAVLPGLAESDIQLTATADTLSIAGERSVSAPEGYSVHRQERPAFRFSRSIQLPARIDVEKVAADAKDGVLTVTMAKAPDAQPRQIAVKARS